MAKKDAQAERWKKYLALIIGVVLVLSIISYVWFPLMPWTEERDAGKDVIDQTYDAEQAIENYEWFRQQYNDIEAQRAIIENNYADLERFYETWGNETSEWPREARERHSDIQTRVTGSQNILETMVGDYNARSQQANNELFKCSLPYEVDERFAVRGPPGSGDADEPIDTDPDGNPIDTDGTIPEPEQCDGLPDEIQQAAQNQDS